VLSSSGESIPLTSASSPYLNFLSPSCVLLQDLVKLCLMLARRIEMNQNREE